MDTSKKIFLTIVACVLLVCTPVSANELSMQETKVRLQSDLQKHIYRSLVDGAYHTLDSKTGEVRELFPLVSHPMILRMGKYFVMCADFRDSNGKDVDVDFYMIARNKGYQVFRAEIDNHELLDSLMKTGKAEIFQ